MFKYCSSAEKAFKKLNSEKHKTKNITVQLSNPVERPDIEGDEENSEDRNEGKVVYLKFKDSECVVGKEQLKTLLKRYGLITKIFIKKEGKSYYIEFSSPSSAHDLIKDYNNNVLPKELKNITEVDYAFNKNRLKQMGIVDNDDNAAIEEKKANTLQTIVEKNENSLQIQEINPNNLWQVYYDQTHERNFYFNPFYNESVWELPEGAELNPNQYSNYYYDPNVNEAEAQEISNEISKTEALNERVEQSHYDEEAWEEDEIMDKIIWDKMKEQQLKDWMKRPARQQVTDTRKDTAYIEGNYDYNIWYDKYLTDRKEEKEKVPALYRCSSALDTGFTKADLQEKEGGAFFCMFFAKGCCTEGVNCRYYHRVPTKEDAEKIENLRDVFGRSRFATHRTDMGGVGSFTKECRTIYVTDLKTVESVNANKEMMRIIYENFSPWGEIEDINYIPSKAACFIRYAHRCFAEFGKEAMIGQALVGEEILTVRWAYNDPNPMNKRRIEKEHENRFLSAYQKKQENLNRLKQLNAKNPMPNTDYHSYYNNKNNPYAYTSGYGYDSYETATGNRDSSNQVADNYMKLSKTLEMIDREFNEEK
jgi:hypothetical protein